MLMLAVSVTDCPVVAGFRFEEIVIAGVVLAELIVFDLDPTPVSKESSPS
jgi:hypothetical protein